MSDYRQVDCRSYDEFERAIMAKRRLRVNWRDASGLDHLEVLTPTDLETCKGEEFLLARNHHGKAFRLRLDHIVRASVLPRKPLF